jgi:Ca2+-binding EF-hand superfamily protein
MLVASALCAMAWGGVQANERTFGDGTLPDFLAVYDVDGNGTLSVEEIQAMKDARRARHDEWLAQWDTDGDGVISEAERMAARDALRDRIEDRRTNRFAEADADGNGCLTLAEFSVIPAVTNLAAHHTNAPALIYDRLDLNDDDCVSQLEFLAHLRHHRPDWRNRETYHRADVNTNGCLTLVEFSAIPAVVRMAQENTNAPLHMYIRLDVNRDHCLTIEEFVAPLPPPPPPPWRTEATYDTADANNNNCLSPAEFATIPEVIRAAQMHPDAPARMYNELDRNDDECLTLAEFTGALPPPPGS